MGTDFVVLGTYPPTQCGLATFSAALLGDLPGPGDRVGVVRVLDEPAPDMPPPVVHDLVNGTVGAAEYAAAVMNRFSVAIIQHEYGIYGGPDGADLLPLMSALTVPSIVVLHTVLAEPDPWQKMILGEVIAAASAVVTMTETGRQRVLDQYGTDPAKVTVIPHGAATYWASARPADTAAAYWQRLGLPARLPARLPGRLPGILTWGLIGPGKGIEHAIDAIALLRDEGIRVRYTIAGETHPKVRARSGEAYRRSLQDRVARLGLLDLVRFDDRYLAPRALARQHLLRGDCAPLVEGIRWMTASSYDAEFDPRLSLSERVLWPGGPADSHGMEDARFVRFTPDGGDAVYLATYSAYDGRRVASHLLKTRDFRTFAISPLSGQSTRNKGLAIFPRPVGGRYAALSRWDRESNAIAYSDDGHRWDDAVNIQVPARPWDAVQLGNCGSPLETEAGWLVFTHGVGPMREYAIGAILLDLAEPERLIGSLPEPLLIADETERAGYVPDVVYSCGALRHGGTIVLPYGCSDSSVRFATVDLPGLLRRLTHP